MKKLTLLLLALSLSGCNGLSELLDGEISLDAKQTFISANGNTIEVVENNAIAPVRVAVTIERLPNGQPTGVASFPIGSQCTSKWMLTQLGNYDPFWLNDGQAGAPSAWYVTYDASENQCGRRRCEGNTAHMDTVVPQTAIVPVECYDRP